MTMQRVARVSRASGWLAEVTKAKDTGRGKVIVAMMVGAKLALEHHDEAQQFLLELSAFMFGYDPGALDIIDRLSEYLATGTSGDADIDSVIERFGLG